MRLSFRSGLLFTAAVVCSTTSAWAQFTETEPNETKALANVIAGLASGGTITGTTTGTSTITPGLASADTYRVSTAAAPLGIYRHQMVLTTTGTVGHGGSLRGLAQSAGVINTSSDNSFQTSSTTTVPARMNQWYGFGKGEQIYYRVSGTTTTTAAYVATLTSTPVAPLVLSTCFNPGTITITTVGQTTVDTDMWVYDSGLNAIATFGNDDEPTPGTTLQSKLVRTFTPGTYYLALGRFSIANDQASASDDRYRSGTVLDFPNAAAESSTTVPSVLNFSISDGGTTTAVPFSTTTPYEICWAQFTVSSGACPPGNDACASAYLLPASSNGNTTLATNDGSSSCDLTGNDVWYTYTAGATPGVLNVNTCGSAIDTVVTLYSGACGALTELACNDDFCGTGSSVSIALAAAQAVVVRVSDKGVGGAFVIASGFYGTPANDACASATTLSGTAMSGNTVAATNDGSSTCDATGRDVWYSYTAPAAAGTLNLNTCTSAIDGVISVYDVCGGTELACDDNSASCGGNAASVALPLAASQSVKIRVSDKGIGAFGSTFVLNWNFYVPPPANDECATATVITGSGSWSADNVWATTSAGVPTACATNSKDVWFAWTSQGAGSAQVDTCNAAMTSGDSVLAVYTGTCGALTQIACDDDTCTTPGLASQLTFTAACTTTYYIRVAAYGAAGTGMAWVLNVTAPGFVDTDGDGVDDCLDGCPTDPLKIAPGICGCGFSDTLDTDGDGTVDCLDGCPTDPAKTAPGLCGCGVADTDTDGDGSPDCLDGCPTDPLKTAPGVCGCFVYDTDGDGFEDCVDGCPLDPFKTSAGQCGCGVADTDSDGDGVADCIDGCPTDPLKTSPGACGCGVADTDTDLDGTPDCNDGCPTDPAKIAPGQCGCGNSELDTDGDGVADCVDNCDNIANPTQGDCNGDGVGDACEIAAGALDTNGNGIPDSCEGPVTYCTAGTSTNGCLPAMSASGTPSAAATSGFTLTCTGAEGAQQGLIFFGISGPNAGGWGASSSFMCVKAPFERTGVQTMTGTLGACDGSMSVDFLSFMSTHPSALGNPLFAGEVFNAQCWYRDPPSPKTTMLSNGLQWSMLP